MSTNCINCVVNKRTGFDLLCDDCRALRSVPKTDAVAIQPLTGHWTARCGVCGKEYSQQVGSTPCCGSVAEITSNRFDSVAVKAKGVETEPAALVNPDRWEETSLPNGTAMVRCGVCKHVFLIPHAHHCV